MWTWNSRSYSTPLSWRIDFSQFQEVFSRSKHVGVCRLRWFERVSFKLRLVRFLHIIKNFLATWYCIPVLNYTLHVNLFFRLNTKDMIVWQIFCVRDTVVDRFNFALLVQVSFCAAFFLDIEYKTKLVLVFWHMAFSQLQSIPSSALSAGLI